MNATNYLRISRAPTSKRLNIHQEFESPDAIRKTWTAVQELITREGSVSASARVPGFTCEIVKASEEGGAVTITGGDFAGEWRVIDFVTLPPIAFEALYFIKASAPGKSTILALVGRGLDPNWQGLSNML